MAANQNSAVGGCPAGAAPPVVDTIAFAIPGTGVRTIAVPFDLPNITEPVLVDGLTQPGASCTGAFPTLNVFLQGTAGAARGLTILGGGTTVRGLVIDDFTGAQVQVEPTVGGNGNRLHCNVLGMDPTGTSAGTEFAATTLGVLARNATDLVVGTDGDGVGDAREGNWIAGNDAGIELDGPFSGPGTTGIRIAGNRIGTNAGGAAAPTGSNQRYGILVTQGIAGAVIGSDGDGTSDVEERNVIAFHGSPAGGGGVVVWNGSERVQVRSDSLFANAPLDLNLGFPGDDATSEANDPGDADTGANQLQNRPVLAAVSRVAGNLRVTGTLPSAPSQDFEVELFGSAACNASGFGPGESRLGATAVATDALGTAAFDVIVVPQGATRFVTALATDVAGNTSEFSTCVEVPLLADGFEG